MRPGFPFEGEGGDQDQKKVSAVAGIEERIFGEAKKKEEKRKEGRRGNQALSSGVGEGKKEQSEKKWPSFSRRATYWIVKGWVNVQCFDDHGKKEEREEKKKRGRLVRVPQGERMGVGAGVLSQRALRGTWRARRATILVR